MIEKNGLGEWGVILPEDGSADEHFHVLGKIALWLNPFPSDKPTEEEIDSVPDRFLVNVVHLLK